MVGLGTFEVLFLLLGGLVLGAVIFVIFAAVRAGARPGGQLAWRTPGLLPPIPAHVQHEVREMWAAGRKIEAIKLIRERTGLGLKEAKMIAETLGAGQAVPVHPAGSAHLAAPDLATRVRELKAAGRIEQAVFLVRGETGMGQTEAEAFVNTL
ncbi:hypothetical protein Mth01_41730 [Sphaerimonospora thailandensis]|uniref:Large ribosomal subunit protein bL12 C-terminal domain-containing protein n=1 Tax=Sphaerimonospora thailandensis TaxID=795644 RepID=A0A8J3RBR4_9ACTN|nr:hypothetical protein Mth01_41730 [Sphaerimonospora thailandensis]